MLKTLSSSKNSFDFVNQPTTDKNVSGLYNGYPLQRSNQKKSILKQFYPKKI